MDDMKKSIIRHLQTMKPFSLVIFLSCALSSFSQNSYENIFSDGTKEVSWTCRIAYLPSPQSEYIALRANRSKLSVKYRSFIIRKRYRRRITKRVKFNKKDFGKFYELYNSLDQQLVNFPITNEDKDSLRKFLNDTLYNGQRRYKLDSIQLNHYLEKNFIEIDMSVFQIDSINNFPHGFVIDGAPFYFQTMTVTNKNDSIVHFYKGNLAGGDRYRDFSKYLIYSTLYNETTLFDRLPFNMYFSRSNVLRVFLKYIEGKEGLLEFKPFEFFIEDKE